MQTGTGTGKLSSGVRIFMSKIVGVYLTEIYVNYVYMYIYLGCDLFPDDFGRFRRGFLDANGHTDGHTDIRTDSPSYRDARTHLKSGIFSIEE